MSPVLVVHLVVVLVAIALAILVYLLARRSLAELLSRTVAVPGGVVFFTRAFLLLLIFGVVGPAVTGNPDVKPGQHFMEYVWFVAAGLADSLEFGLRARFPGKRCESCCRDSFGWGSCFRLCWVLSA